MGQAMMAPMGVKTAIETLLTSMISTKVAMRMVEAALKSGAKLTVWAPPFKRLAGFLTLSRYTI